VRDDSTPDGGEDVDGTAEAPVTLEQLADLQAGLLDDAAATRLRRLIRDDPDVARQFAALQQVRHDLKALAAAPAADPPVEVTAAISGALRGAPPVGQHPPMHAARRRVPPSAWIGAAAAAAAVVVAVTMLRHDAEPSSPTAAGPTASSLTAPRHSGMPMSDHTILGLLQRPADLGSLTDPSRLRSCLQGLGYSAPTPVLGATVVEGGRVLLLLPESDPRSVMALLVTEGCRADAAGLLADALLTRP